MKTTADINPTMIQMINHWQHIEPYAKVPHTKTEYQKQRALLEKLMELAASTKNEHIVNPIQLVTRNLKAYEDEHFPLERATAIDVLRFLMDEHGLSQSNLPEIGSQSLVSKILKGERKLTADQIGRLAGRFHVSPAVFYSH
jgi:HTH-type transcriptional regulator/antitoxin HigA